jgi:hypothetical protein
MATKNELIERGNKLAEKYSENELKSALKNAVMINDNEERLALQWALKKVTNTKDGYRFAKEQHAESLKKLTV